MMKMTTPNGTLKICVKQRGGLIKAVSVFTMDHIGGNDAGLHHITLCLNLKYKLLLSEFNVNQTLHISFN